MDEERKTQVLGSVASRHGLDAESPTIAEEWASWSAENEHLSGASVTDAIRSFVSHLTKRGIISTTTASTEARVAPSDASTEARVAPSDASTEARVAPSGDLTPSETHLRHLTNASHSDEGGAGPAGGEYDSEGEGLDEVGGGPAVIDESPLGGEEEEYALPPYDEAMRSGDHLLGGDGEDKDPDYQEHGDVVGGLTMAHLTRYHEEQVAAAAADFDSDDGVDDGLDDSISAMIDELDLGDDDDGYAAGELLEAGAPFGRLTGHSRDSALMSMLVTFAARHNQTDPDSLDKMHNQGMLVGEDVARGVAAYVRRRWKNASAAQLNHMRSFPATVLVQWIGAAGSLNAKAVGSVAAKARARAEMAFEFLEHRLNDYFEQMFPGEGGMTAEQYKQKQTVPIGDHTEDALRALAQGTRGFGRGVWGVAKGTGRAARKTAMGTRRAYRKGKSMGRAGLNSSQRESIKRLLVGMVRRNTATAHGVPGHGSALGARVRVSTSAINLKRRLEDPRRTKATLPLITMLTGMVHAYVTSDVFQPNAYEIIDDVFTEIKAVRAKRDFRVPATGTATATGTIANVTGVLPQQSSAAIDLGNRLVAAAATYLRENPSCIKKAGTEFVLPVPAEGPQHQALKRTLDSSSAEDRKRYLRHALLARHPNAELDQAGVMLSLSGRAYHVRQSTTAKGGAVAALRIQRLRRDSPAGAAYEDVWDTELRNAGGRLTVCPDHETMHCDRPAGIGAKAVHTVQGSVHAGSAPVDIRPLFYRVGPSKNGGL